MSEGKPILPLAEETRDVCSICDESTDGVKLYAGDSGPYCRACWDLLYEGYPGEFDE